jgi:molybdate transport system ATP-binding protein
MGLRPLVELERASVTLGGAAVLRDVTVTLRAGDRWAILGGNGSGKSTLLRLLRGDQWLDPLLPGRRRFWSPGGAPSASPIGARERMALVGPEGQDEYARADLDLPVEAVIRSGLDGERYPVEGATPERTARVERAADALGVRSLLRRRFLSLSRGEARRVLVARALAPGPDVLLLDEVCDGLDHGAREALLARLSRMASAVSVVTATHREEEIFPGVTRVLRLEGGRVVEAGRLASGRVSTGRVSSGRVSAGARAPAGGRPAAARGATGRAPASPRLFELRDVTVRVEGRAILKRVSWSIRQGEAWGVTGPNGAGKSTLLRLLLGEEQPATGVIRRLDLGPRADLEEVRRRVGQVSPELQARHRAGITGEAVVLSGFLGTVGLAERPTPRQRAAATRALARLGLSHLGARRFLTCSYGEQRLLLVARALVARPAVVLLDEPFAGLSGAARRSLAAALAGLVRDQVTLVLVSHHEDELGGLATRRAGLRGGRLQLER